MKVGTRLLRNVTAVFASAALIAGAAGIVGYVSTSSETAEASIGHRAHRESSGDTRTRDAVRFRNQMRKLWEDHIVWTRQFIVSAATEAENLPDTGPTVDRLLANQSDIGNAIKPFYGDAAGDALTALLREHILGAADLIVLVGFDPVEPISRPWSYTAPVVDIARVRHPIPRVKPTAGVYGSLQPALDALRGVGRASAVRPGLGEQAATLLLQQIVAGLNLPSAQGPTPTLTARESTAPPAARP